MWWLVGCQTAVRTTGLLGGEQPELVDGYFAGIDETTAEVVLTSFADPCEVWASMGSVEALEDGWADLPQELWLARAELTLDPEVVDLDGLTFDAATDLGEPLDLSVALWHFVQRPDEAFWAAGQDMEGYGVAWTSRGAQLYVSDHEPGEFLRGELGFEAVDAAGEVDGEVGADLRVAECAGAGPDLDLGEPVGDDDDDDDDEPEETEDPRDILDCYAGLDPLVERSSAGCDASDRVVFTIEAEGWASRGVMLSVVTAGGPPRAEEHELELTQYDDCGVYEVRELRIETDADYVPGRSSAFTCDEHYDATNGVMTYAAAIWDLDGGLADCMAFGKDGPGLVRGDYAAAVDGVASFDLGGCGQGVR